MGGIMRRWFGMFCGAYENKDVFGLAGEKMPLRLNAEKPVWSDPMGPENSPNGKAFDYAGIASLTSVKEFWQKDDDKKEDGDKKEDDMDDEIRELNREIDELLGDDPIGSLSPEQAAALEKEMKSKAKTKLMEMIMDNFVPAGARASVKAALGKFNRFLEMG